MMFNLTVLVPAILILALIIVLFCSIPTKSLLPHPDPTTSYDEAEKRLQAWVEEEAGLSLQEVCHTIGFSQVAKPSVPSA